MTDLQFRMLGPLEVWRGPVALPIAPGRPRVLLAILLVHLNEVVSTDRLLEELWRGDPPPSAAHALQVYVSTLRRALEPDRRAGAAAQVVVTRRPGYVLEAPPEACDARRFEALAAEGGRAVDEHRPEDATVILDDGLRLWRGQVLVDLAGEPFVGVEATRLEELRLVANERRTEAQLALGRHGEVVRVLEALVVQHPFREHLWGQLMVALYRSGRQADALRAYRRLRQTLVDQLGLEPSPELRLLEAAILRHDPTLAAHHLNQAPSAGPQPAADELTPPAVAAATVMPLPHLLTDAGGGFVGRDQEMERIEGLWKEAGAGQLRVVFVAGEPGVGKTRLAAEVAARVHAEGATVLAGRCDEDVAVPYQPFLEALRQFIDHTPTAALSGHLGRFAGELVRLVPDLDESVPDLPPPLRSDPETERYRLFDAVTAWLAAASADAPLLLVLDDLQWAVKATLLLLRHVACSAGRSNVLVLGTYRDTELAPDHPLVDVLADLRRHAGVERLSLTGFDQSQVAAYIDQVSTQALGDHRLTLARALHDETDGNPFFVREVLRHLIETGAVNWGGDTAARSPLGELGVPQGVSEVVGRRLARLSQGTNQVLRTAAVVGTQFDPALLAAGDVTDSGLISALEEATAAGLIIEVTQGGYRFAHALVRDTLYHGLSAVRRETVHRQVAEAIEIRHAGRLDEHLPALAHHFARASDGAAKAVDYATRAGDRAVAQLAFDAAVAYYGQALSALDGMVGDTTKLRGVVLLALARARARTGDVRAGDTYLSAAEAARHASDAETLAGAALGLTDLWASSGSVNDTRISLLEEARRALGGATSSVTAQLLARLAMELYAVPGSWDRRDRLSAESVEVAHRLGHPLTLALSLHARNYALWGPGGAHERLTQGRDIVGLAEAGGDPEVALQGHAWCQIALLELGDVAGLDAALTAYHRLAEDLRQPRYRWYGATRLATRALLSGDLDRGERMVRDARPVGREAGEPDAEYVFAAQMFVVWQERPCQEAVEVLHAGSRTAEATLPEDSPLVMGFRLMHLLVLLDTPGGDGVEAELNQVLEFALGKLDHTYYGMGWAILVVLLAAAAVRLARRDAAAALYDLLLPYAGLNVQNCGAVGFHGSYTHHLGILAAGLERWDAAEEHLADADAVHQRMGAGAYLARTRLEWARMLLGRRDRGDVERAGELLGHALTAARQSGLVVVERRATELLT